MLFSSFSPPQLAGIYGKWKANGNTPQTRKRVQRALELVHPPGRWRKEGSGEGELAVQSNAGRGRRDAKTQRKGDFGEGKGDPTAL